MEASIIRQTLVYISKIVNNETFQSMVDLLLSFCSNFVCFNIQWCYSTSDDNAITTSNSLFALTHSLSDPKPRVAIYHLHIKIPKISGFHLWFGLSAFANKRVKFSDNDQLHGLILNIILTNTSAPVPLIINFKKCTRYQSETSWKFAS